MLKNLKSHIKFLLNLYPSRTCKLEYERQTFNRFNERPVEYSFVFRKLAETYPKKVLDVGTGTTALPHLVRNCGMVVTAIDNVRDYWPDGMFNRHYHVLDDDICNTRLKGTFEFITCISVLEHIEMADSAVRNMFSLLIPGGHLILTFPYTEKSYVRNVYQLQGSSYGQDAPYITQSFSRTELERWLRDNQGVIAEQEFWQFWDGDHWTVGKQIIPPNRTSVSEPHQITCLHICKS